MGSAGRDSGSALLLQLVPRALAGMAAPCCCLLKLCSCRLGAFSPHPLSSPSSLCPEEQQPQRGHALHARQWQR